ncbi:MAG: PEGA domain-containing protein [Chitinivibrionales bacterium]|nr:PEGA domain-containing protein [Chitinivibrionales bacterium]
MNVKNRHFIHIIAIIAAFYFSAIAEDEGILSVITDPQGVEVWLGEKYLGDTPIYDRKLQSGKYVLKLIDPIQHVSSIEDIVIQNGKSTVIETSLKTKFGTLKVDSEPAGAEVAIYGMLGKTPLENNFMHPGKYTIEVKHPKNRYIPVKSEVTIPQGRKVEITNTLARRTLLDTKAFLRLLFGAGAVGGYVWALIERGEYKMHKTQLFYLKNAGSPEEQLKDIRKQRDEATLKMNLGIVAGSLCVVSFEIVAFF